MYTIVKKRVNVRIVPPNIIIVIERRFIYIMPNEPAVIPTAKKNPNSNRP